ncbi:hypothetical protein C2S51_017984 [Perilla frutescens var. frutescens]|nr:hypothetical protein C2S51_017984 [Perilla frutescens var. frutescens]
MYWISIEPRGTPFLVLYNQYEATFRKRRQQPNEISRRHQEVCATPTQPTQLPQPTQLLKEACGPTNRQGDGLPKGPSFGPDDSIYDFTSSQRQALVHEVGEYIFGRVMGWMDTAIPQHIENVLRRVLPEFMTHNTNLYEREKGHETMKENSHETTTKPTTPIVLHNDCNDDRQNLSVDEIEVRETYEPVSDIRPDFRDVRKRIPSIVLRSPFLPDDIRGKDYNKVLKLKAKRNVGIEFDIGASFFCQIENPITHIENSHLDAYLAIIHTDPSFAKLYNVRTDVMVTSSSFLIIVQQIWLKHHKEGVEENIDVNIEEQLSEEDLQGLSKYVMGDLPSWGLPKPCYDYIQLVMPCHLPGHWVAVVVYLKEHTIGIFDSTRHILTGLVQLQMRTTFMKPLARILPQMLKYYGYWEARSELVPKYTQ